MSAPVQLKRSTPIEFTYFNAAGEACVFTAPACTVAGYRAALELDVTKPAAFDPVEASDRLMKQAVLMCGEACRTHLEQMDALMLQQVIQAQAALYSGLNPEGVVKVLEGVKKKALAGALQNKTS